jgi:hypothetical protein
MVNKMKYFFLILPLLCFCKQTVAGVPERVVRGLAFDEYISTIRRFTTGFPIGGMFRGTSGKL